MFKRSTNYEPDEMKERGFFDSFEAYLLLIIIWMLTYRVKMYENRKNVSFYLNDK